jgi:glycosyltransferase involved in cell wall biosynthesis
VRVALAHPTYWPEVRRGAERLMHDLAVALPHEVTIVTSGTPSVTVEDGVRVVRLWHPPDGRLDRRLFEPHVALLPFTYQALKRGRFDVVQGLQPGDAVAGIRTGTPTIFSHMGIPHRAAIINRRMRMRLTLEAVKGARACTALSEHAGLAFKRWLGVDARVIHPPVDTERFTPGGERSEHPTIVCAADAREPRKRVGLLREAMTIVRRSEPKAQLLLDARTAPGGIPMDDLPAIYRRAWVSALPSWGEAFGLVLAEALACGTPVVGADLHGIPEVLGGDDTIGRLFDGDEPEAVARALLEAIELARDPGTAARCRARALEFSAGRCAEHYDALYREVLSA